MKEVVEARMSKTKPITLDPKRQLSGGDEWSLTKVRRKEEGLWV